MGVGKQTQIEQQLLFRPAANSLFSFLHCFKTGICYVVQAGLKIVVQCIFQLIITLPQSPKHLVKSVTVVLVVLAGSKLSVQMKLALKVWSPLLK